MLEDDGDQGDAHRAAELLRETGDHAGVGDLRAVQPEVGGAHRRDHGGTQGEAADEQCRQEQPLAGPGGDEGERHGRRGDECERHDGDRARTEAVGVPPGQAAGQQRAEALRDQQ